MRRSRHGRFGDSETEGFVCAGDNRETWSRYCEMLCVKPGRRRFSDASDCILLLALTFIGIHDGTSDVEPRLLPCSIAGVQAAGKAHVSGTFA